MRMPLRWSRTRPEYTTKRIDIRTRGPHREKRCETRRRRRRLGDAARFQAAPARRLVSRRCRAPLRCDRRFWAADGPELNERKTDGPSRLRRREQLMQATGLGRMTRKARARLPPAHTLRRPARARRSRCDVSWRMCVCGEEAVLRVAKICAPPPTHMRCGPARSQEALGPSPVFGDDERPQRPP